MEKLGDEVDEEKEEKLSVEGFSIALGVPVAKNSICGQCAGVVSPVNGHWSTMLNKVNKLKH